MLQLLFLLLKNIDDSSLNKVLSQNELYAKLDPSDIAILPKIKLDNFVNICNFVNHYQLIDETEFIANIQYHILRKTKEVIDNINYIPLNMRSKVYQNECLTEMKCEHYKYKTNIKHIACYKFLEPSHYYGINEASRDGHLELIKYLFKIGKNCTRWAIELASKNGHFDVVKYLCKVTNIDYAKYAIEFACSGGHLEIVKYLFEVLHQDCSMMAIKWASQNGHLDIVKYLITIQHKKYTKNVITMAKIHNYLEIAEYLKLHPDSFIQ